MDVAGRFQRVPDRTDAAIHHVARRHDVDSGCRLHQRLPDQDGDRLVVENVAVVVDQSVLPMGRVRIKCHVGQHAESRKALLQRLDGAWHESVGVGRFGTVFGLQCALDHRE